MKNVARKTVLSVATLGLMAGISMGALATPYGETYIHGSAANTQSIRIKFSAADLASDEGRAELHSRIKRTARKVCGPTTWREAGGLRNMSRNRACYDSAVESALGQLEPRQVAALGD